mmetsp:Transcript_26532/g.89274  ORF Transcript_26532/g.89274 Transcript_26532/m.89274 type:complete len:213 (-) Transcript_26532:30-668(-)
MAHPPLWLRRGELRHRVRVAQERRLRDEALGRGSYGQALRDSHALAAKTRGRYFHRRVHASHGPHAPDPAAPPLDGPCHCKRRVLRRGQDHKLPKRYCSCNDRIQPRRRGRTAPPRRGRRRSGAAQVHTMPRAAGRGRGRRGPLEVYLATRASIRCSRRQLVLRDRAAQVGHRARGRGAAGKAEFVRLVLRNPNAHARVRSRSGKKKRPRRY